MAALGRGTLVVHPLSTRYYLQSRLWRRCIAHAKFRSPQVLTPVGAEAYITGRFGTPPPRRDGASSKLLTDMGDQASDLGREPAASTALHFQMGGGTISVRAV